MDDIKSYTDLDVWQKSRDLVITIYEMSKNLPREEQFGLIQQIRRSAISIPSNIAEGCGRETSKDTIRFLYIARGSLYELESQLYIASDLNYIEKSDLDNSLEKIVECKKLLNGFINYFKSLS